MPITVGQALADARRKIDALDARVLLCHVVQRDAGYLIAHADAALGAGQQHVFQALVTRRRAGEPVAYMTGRREFFGLDFKATPAVLIPRPETELLVELGLEHIPQNKPCRVLDLGTGSGCVAISIVRHRPLARVIATDISAEALAVARENATNLLRINPAEPPVGKRGLGGISFTRSNWYEALAGDKFDVIIANPPYVAEHDRHLDQGDLRFEPRAALVAGADGLDCIRGIVRDGASHLVAGGWLMFEHGLDQAASCRGLLQAAGFGLIYSWKDLAGHERVCGGQLDAARH